MNELIKQNIPEGYELYIDDNYVLKKNQPFLYSKKFNYCIDNARDFAGKPLGFLIKNLDVLGALVPIGSIKPLDPQEKIKFIKKQAREFVNRHIKEPNESIYSKFEEEFLKEDKSKS